MISKALTVKAQLNIQKNMGLPLYHTIQMTLKNHPFDKFWKKENINFSPFPTIFPTLSNTNSFIWAIFNSLPHKSRLLTTARAKSFENSEWKGENAGNQQFLHFLQYFILYHREESSFKQHLICLLQMLSIWFNQKICPLVLSAPTFNLVWAKALLFGRGLTLSQTRNFRLYQIEKFCRRQFPIWWKCRQFSKWIGNTVGQGEIACYE